jgi:hypothetical protein
MKDTPYVDNFILFLMWKELATKLSRNLTHAGKSKIKNFPVLGYADYHIFHTHFNLRGLSCLRNLVRAGVWLVAN